MGILYLLVLCLLWTGCGGGKTEAPAPEPPPAQTSAPAPPAPKADDRPVIAVFGDSLTAGFGVDPGFSFPDFMQKDLDAAGLRYRIVNAGVSGDTTTDGLARVGDVIAQQPKIVILEFGGNDGLRGLPVATTRSNLEQMVEALQKAGIRVVLAGMTLPPNYGPDYIRSFEQVYRDLTTRYKLTLIPFLLAGVGGTTQYMQRDGLHPNVEGNRIVAANVMRVLKPLL